MNVCEEPQRGYEISPQALIAIERRAREEQLEILGFVHSHPDAAPHPSARDLAQAWWLGCSYGILSVREGTFRELQFFRLVGTSVETRHFLPEGVRIAPRAI
jgi:proteasome lid subunit RPN8/RPN11